MSGTASSSGKARAESVEWPERWGAPAGGKNVSLLVFMLLLAAGFAAITVITFRDSDGRAVLTFFGFLLVAGTAAFVGLTRLGLRSRAASSVRDLGDSTGVMIPYSAAVVALYWALGAIAIMPIAAIAVASAASLVMGSDAVVGGVIGLVVCGGAVIFFLAFALHGIRGKLARGFVALTAEGIRHRGWAFDSFAPWGSVIGVEPAEMDGPLIHVIVLPGGTATAERTSGLWTQEELALAPSLAIRGRWLSVDPALLFHALRYYHANPEARGELTSSAAAQRVRAARFE